jgi:tetratricopeptide (TPR) repeat protein
VIGDDNQALAAASQLTYVVGFSAARHAEGLVWSHSAEMLLDRLGLRGSLREADHLDNLASIRLEQGQVDEALTLFTRALELNEHLLSREHPSVAHALSNLATAQITHGDHAAATLGLERSLAIAEREFGPDHPEVATTLNNLAASKRAEGDLEAAHALHLRALALRERVLRPGHPDITTSLNNLADVERQRGDHDQAFAINTRALAILERERGPDHLDIAFSLNNLALVHQERREYEQAIALQDRALQDLRAHLRQRARRRRHRHSTTSASFTSCAATSTSPSSSTSAPSPLRERLGGPDQFPVGLSLFRLATIHRLRGEYDPGRRPVPACRRHLAEGARPDSPELAWPLVGQGQLALARGRPREAVPLIERALRLRGDDTSKPDRLAEARFALAKALVAADKHHDRSRVLALAQEAADAYRGFGDSAALAEVEAWSRTRR